MATYGGAFTAREPAIGYIGYVTRDPVAREETEIALREFAARVGMEWIKAWRDDGFRLDDRPDSALCGLVSQLRICGRAAVLIHDPRHLSVEPKLRAWKARMIVHAGGRLVIVNDRLTDRIVSVSAARQNPEESAS